MVDMACASSRGRRWVPLYLSSLTEGTSLKKKASYLDTQASLSPVSPLGVVSTHCQSRFIDLFGCRHVIDPQPMSGGVMAGPGHSDAPILRNGMRCAWAADLVVEASVVHRT